ncbi:hypothetical protein [Vibrio parahaemolyticus]|uniref:hypothetical protein n=1 Tax=Vibrio parahaemolyticus TaxID=670 RepID=UPI002362509E|nr:hypothetical protein [Vibrio parahaemolyticus]HCE2128430.1 hypothetical protein [Vibrio parahaemolyticus]
MSILNWFTGLFSDNSVGSENLTDIDHDSFSSGFNDSAINPANGLPMVGGEGGVDVEGNAYGTDFSHDSFSSVIDDSFGSSFDDSFSSGGGFNEW